MQGSVIDTRLRSAGHLDLRGAIVVALALVWTATAILVVSGGPDLGQARALVPLGLVGIPTVLVTAAVFAHERLGSPVVAAAAWTGTGFLALAAAVAVDLQPLVGVAVPGALVSGLLCRRFPVAATVTLFFISGTFASVRAFSSVPVGETADLLIAGLLLAALLNSALRRDDRRLVVSSGMALVAMYALLTIFQALATAELGASLISFRAAGWYLLLIFGLAYAGWDQATHMRVARGFVAVAAIVGLYATVRFFIGPADAEALGATPLARLDGSLKLIGSFASRHQLGAWTAELIPFCTAFALGFRDRWRFLAAAAAALCTFGLIASEARAALVAAAVGVVLVIAMRAASRAFPGLNLGVTALAVIVIAGAGVAGFSLTVERSEGSSDRFARILNPGSDAAFVARTFKWRTALEDINDHPAGQGLGSARARDTETRTLNVARVGLDSAYLKIAYEQGMAVMVIFGAGMILLLLGLGRRAVTTVDPARAALAMGACGTLAAFLVVLSSALYMNGLQALAPWSIVGLGVAQFAFLVPRAPTEVGSAP